MSRATTIVSLCLCGTLVRAGDDSALQREARQRALAEARLKLAEREIEQLRLGAKEERHAARQQMDRIAEQVQVIQAEAVERIDELREELRNADEDVDRLRKVAWNLRAALARALAEPPAPNPADPEPAVDPPQRSPVPAAFRKRTRLIGDDERLAASFRDTCDFIADIALGSVAISFRTLDRSEITWKEEVPIPKGVATLDAHLRQVMARLDESLELRYDGSVAVVAVWNDVAIDNLTKPVKSDDDPESIQVLARLAARSVQGADLTNIDFSDAIAYLQDVSDVPIEVDWDGLRQSLVNEKTRVDVRCRSASHRTLLNLVLFAAGDRLSYEVRKGVLHVVRVERPQRDEGPRE